jgi:hypothetical protein
MKPKTWHIIVIAVGLLVGLGSVGYFLATRQTDVVTHVIYCIDVETGEMYKIDTQKFPVVLPARHPSTGRVCLVRVSKDEHGAWYVKPRDRQTLSMLDADVKNTAIDAESGELHAAAKEPIEYIRKQ